MVGSREAGTVDLNQGATAFAASSRARCLNLWANWCTLVGTSLRAAGLPLLGLGLEERPRLFWCTHDDSLTWHDQNDRAPRSNIPRDWPVTYAVGSTLLTVRGMVLVMPLA